MEKRVVVAMLLSVGLMLGWSALSQMYAPPPAPSTGGGTPVAHTGTTGAPTDPPVGTGGGDGPAPVVPPVAVDPPEQAPEVVELVQTDVLLYELDSVGGALRRAEVWACEYHAPGTEGVLGDPTSLSAPGVAPDGFLAIDLHGVEVDLTERNWTVTRDDDIVMASTVVSLDDGVRVEIVKTLRPSADPAMPFHVDVDVELRGLGEPSRRATLEIIGPWMPKPVTPMPGEDGLLLALIDEDGDVEVESPLQPEEVAESIAENPEFATQAPYGIGWLGVRGDFHLGALEPLGALPKGAYVGYRTRLTKTLSSTGREEPWNTAAATVRIPIALPGNGDRQIFKFRAFMGPTSRDLMTADDAPYADFATAIPQRMMSIKPIENVLSWLLGLLAGTGMGYGLAIASLTVLVRGALFPLSRKSQISMRVHSKRMSSIKPKMDAIKKRFKDPKKQQEETMKLMRKEKISPVPGGCLLAFVQMPIWISLYGILQTTYEMRHAKFLWAADLTGPDHLLHMPWMPDLPLLPEWLNLFPILMMITWGVSARMQPLPDDPQQRQTAKMMRWMPMMFGLILYNYASGLTIYMTCSAIWSIGEVQLIRRVWLNKLDV